MAMPISLHAILTNTTLFKPISSSVSSSSSSSSHSRRTSHVASARKGLSSRTRRSERKKGAATSTPTKEEEMEAEAAAAAAAYVDIGAGGGGGGEIEYSTEPMPKLEGLEPDFWEGPQWNALGFFLQYMWAFGILFGLVACGVAVATYNEGATDFKKTPVYKESIESRELLEEPEASNSDVFEANPTEDAPSLE